MSMPAAKTMSTYRCCQATRGTMDRSQADPICVTMFFAVFHASSFA